MESGRTWLTVTEVAGLFDKSEETIRRWCSPVVLDGTPDPYGRGALVKGAWYECGRGSTLRIPPTGVYGFMLFARWPAFEVERVMTRMDGLLAGPALSPAALLRVQAVLGGK